MLRLRPYPQTKEHLIEYLMRLCYINGFFKVTDLLLIIGMSPVKYGQISIWKPHYLKNLNEVLTVALGRPCDDVIALHKRTDNDSWLYGYDRVLQELIVDFPRICVHCVNEEKVIDWRWAVGTVARCSKHLVPLMDTCPSCEKPLVWDANILEFCPKCKKHWDLTSTKKYPPLTSMEESFWPDINGNMRATEKQIKDLTYAIYMSARPFDILIQHFGRIPFSKNHYQLVINGMNILTSENYRNKWRKKCERYWKTYPSYIHPTHHFLENVEVTDELHQLQPTNIIERPEYLQKARITFITNKDNEKPTYHINLATLAETVNLSISDTTILFESRVFKIIHLCFSRKPKNNTLQIFNIKEIIKNTKRFTKGPKEKIEYEKLITGSELLASHLCEYGYIISAVFKKEIHGYFNNVFDLSEVYVDKSSLFLWLEAFRKNQCYQSISISRAASALLTNEETIKSLVYKGDLLWCRHIRKGKFINGKSFIRYIEQLNQQISEPLS